VLAEPLWLYGKPAADEVLGRVKAGIAHQVSLGRRPPTLAVVFVGDNPASTVYIRQKERAAARVGMRSEVVHLAASVSQSELLEVIDRLNGDPAV
jgi:methylenetetrahydrofolate dehydrogenase (NADP+)/methenyltetrahydrofolate cyclohydrolase